MTVTTTTDAGTPEVPVDLVTITVDGVEVSVPKGTLVIRAAELLGIEIPRFCDHPLLEPVGACRQCLVEVEGQLKPLASCTTTVSQGMVVKTQHSSPVADKAQQGVMELLLINHPLDCPVCDKGGECPLQNQAMSTGHAESRFEGVKREFEKPVPISSEVLLDRERCVLCARCTRFSNQVAGDPFIDLQERGALQQVGIYADDPFESYYSGNTIQICPVGALTSAAYRFRSRPFDLVSSPTTCEHCASGCSLRADHRRGKVMRRLAGDEPQVNEEWNCDKGRFAFRYVAAGDRLTTPLIREDGELRAASWPEALAAAADGLAAAASAAVLPGGRVTQEDAYAYGKFARVALGSNDVDHRARAHSAEEEQFLAAAVAGTGLGVTYADIEAAPVVLTVALDAEEESPILLLRLRKTTRRGRTAHYDIAPIETTGLKKTGGTLLAAAPGAEAAVLATLTDGTATGDAVDAAAALRQPGAVILVGERAAASSGTLTAVAELAAATGARLAWVPRRAGERGAVDAGTLPTLLPGGRTVADAAARVDVAAVWGVDTLPETAGRDLTGILSEAAAGRIDALIVGGVDPLDLPDPATAAAALARAFVVSLEIRGSAVHEHADVVFPVAAAPERPGTYLDWEGRPRPFDTVLPTERLTDARVLAMLADELGASIGAGTVSSIRAELAELAGWDGARADLPTAAATAPAPTAGQVVLASWRQLLDNGSLQDGEPALAGTRRPAIARLTAATAATIGVTDGDDLTVTGASGSVTLPVAIVAGADGVVWLPANSDDCRLVDLGVAPGDLVGVTAAVREEA